VLRVGSDEMEALIKKVGDWEINLIDSTTGIFNPIKFIGSMIVLLLIEIFLVSVTTLNDRYLGCIVCGVGFIIVCIMTDILSDNIPAYYVSTDKYGIDSICIIKTTDESDQLEICRAVKIIEDKLMSKIERQNKLNFIAERCK
jgi:hypothetical protein